ncbi:hypothetical protein Lepto7375DRAFT_6104 [Leptolyngbya sp. PCC 7375]|nr:hypothetical protein Lepto7375DRAFT_6104 [Leptolyngbya sp. PCC 7375]
MFCGSKRGSAEDCIQWAIDALCAGQDSPSLRILAGLTPPFYSFEVRDYATKALKELGIEIPTDEKAITAYAQMLITEILADPDCMQDRLVALCNLYIDEDYQDDIYDFYLLRWAFDDLQNSKVQFYWVGATHDNIQEIVITRCREWLIAYENQAH